MEANYVHKDSTTLIQDELVKNELNQIELQYNALKQQKFNELLKENKKLKEKVKKLSQWDINKDTRNSRQRVANAKLLKENQELKKQLENKYKKVGTLTSELLYEENTKLINQQKEFIDYLESEINKIKEQIKNYDIWHEVGTDINFLILKKQFNIEILSKYKEIIGNDK